MRSLTCSVEDPGEVVTTWICGSVTDGMSSWRKVDIDITPRIATAMHTNAMKARLDRLRAARRCIVLLGGTGLPRRRRASRIASASVFGERSAGRRVGTEGRGGGWAEQETKR